MNVRANGKCFVDEENMRKRIIAIVLILMLAVSLLPAAAFADDGGIYVGIGGKYFTALNQTLNVGGGTATLSHESFMNFRLTLNNVNLTSFTKLNTADGVTYYAGIVFTTNDSEGATLIVELKGNNYITAPKHGSSAFYEGFFSNSFLSLNGNNITIKGVDVGVESLYDGANETAVDDPHAALYLGNKNTVISASSADIIAGEFRFAGESCTLSSTGSNCIMTTHRINLDKGTVNMNLTPDVSKGYGNPSAVFSGTEFSNACNCNINVNYNASGYKGAEELTAFGVYCMSGFFSHSPNMKVSVNLQSGGNASAVGVYANTFNNESGEFYASVNLNGVHKESCAVFTEKQLTTSGDVFEASVTGANTYDCAAETAGTFYTNAKNAYLWTDCANPARGAVYAENGTYFRESCRYLRYPLNGKIIDISETSSAGIVTDAANNPAAKVVFSTRNHPFRDIHDQIAIFQTSIIWAFGEGITTGYNPVEFRPGVICNRGQVVTFLWRAMGSPEPETSENPFADVSESGGTAPYYKAILWAYENGITMGFTETEFRPYEGCTRAQTVTFLWRTMGREAAETEKNPFSDVSEESVYYPAILWAAKNGITTGYEDGTFCPDNQCTRAHIVTFLYRTLVGELKSVEVKSFTPVYGEDPVTDPDKQVYLKYYDYSTQGKKWDYAVFNCHLDIEYKTNLTSYMAEDEYTLYLAYPINNGVAYPVDENTIEVCACKNNKLYFTYALENAPRSKRLVTWDFDKQTLTTETCDDCTVFGDYLLIFKPYTTDLNGEHQYFLYYKNVGTGTVSSTMCYSYRTNGDYIYTSYRAQSLANPIPYIMRINPQIKEYVKVYEGKAEEKIYFDETGYNVTSTVDGETIITHYDFP